MAPSSVLDLKAFVPAKDHALAKQFYVDLGFKLNWDNPQTAELEIGSFRFLLQNYYVQRYEKNFMMHLMVEDTDAWRSEEHTSELQSQSNLVCRLLLEKKKT